MKSTWGRIAAIATAITLAVGVAACGGESTGAVGSGDIRTYKIAGYLDFSGPFATRGKAAESTAKMWVENFNAGVGKENNVALEFVSYDTGYNPAKVNEVHRRAVQDDSLIGILGYGSPSAVGIREQLPNDHVPLVLSGSSYSFMKGPGWVFGPVGDPGSAWATGVKWYSDKVLNGKVNPRVALVTFDGSSGKDFISSAKSVLAGSAELVLEEYVPATSTDVGINVERIIAAAPDVVVIGTTDALQPQFFKELRRRGFDMTKVMTAQHESLSQMMSIQVTPADLEGIYEFTTLHYNDQDSDAYKTFAAEREKFGSPNWDGSNQQISSGILTLLDAVEQAAKAKPDGELTGDDVYAALNNGKFEAKGLLRGLEFVENDRQLGATLGTVNQFRSGSITTVADDIPMLTTPSGG
ncbi:MAG: hypothetical protein ABS81_10930 [Pseudonocardia sp. SCN 72-86]|nr:MAG: hypothetical protein ABS81_10930 [Pseudonocardia sp. SCN 72-86]